MLSVIEFIDNKINELNGGNRELRLKLDMLKKVAAYLSKHEVSGRVYEIIQLVDMNIGYSEYRVINDCESDYKEHWVEYMNEKESVRLNPGDFLITIK